MTPFGRPLSDKEKEDTKQNVDKIKEVEKKITEALETVKNAGVPVEIIRKKGQLTVWERIEYLVDPGSWCPLHTLLDPQFNDEGTTGIIDGLAKINGKWTFSFRAGNNLYFGA